MGDLFLELLGMEKHVESPSIIRLILCLKEVPHFHSWFSWLLQVGDMISVIDMPPPEESIWWRGKRGFEVGFFPCECVEVIGDKVPQGLNLPLDNHRLRKNSMGSEGEEDSPNPGSAGGSPTSPSGHEPTKPVLRKHGKLISFFRSFILSRPARGKLKKSGILKERVFGCDLSEHLLNTGSENSVPKVLTHCAEFIEARGIIDGIYRLSGIASNIQKLRYDHLRPKPNFSLVMVYW